MLAKFFYTLIIFPLSLLPLSILYGISNFFLLVVYNILGYRKEVVLGNLKRSFPEKTEQEINAIAHKFYKHFGQLAAEGIKGMTISKKELLRRYHFTNPELVEEYYKKGLSVILVSGHFNNWEFLVQSLDLQFSHQGVGVGKKITSQGSGKIMQDARTRFGMHIWDLENARENFKNNIENKKLFTCMLLADQSPGNPEKSFWMRFLNQDTPTIYGPEYFAKKYNLPVLYYEVKKVKRGYYELTLTMVTEHPTEESYGDITYKHNKLLEQSIVNNPEFWLWSHKRWKHSNRAPSAGVRA